MGSLRAGVSSLVWGLAAVAALVLASAVLLRTLRADEAASPWREWFAFADLLTPGSIASLEVPGWSWLRADAWGSAFGWAVAGVLWLLLGLVGALVLRPRHERREGAERSFTRRANESSSAVDGSTV